MDTIMSNASFSNIYYFIIIPIGLIAYFAFAIFKTKNEKKRVTNWLNEHPNAVKVYIGKTSSVTGYLASAARQISVNSVDGERPLFFTEKLSNGFYVTPGTHIVESSFTKTRPGIIYRSVTTTYGPSKQEITVEGLKSYNYSFDTSEERYVFEAIN
ncbi:hypothetical protein E4N99_04215 [Treponema denticola]|uniref:hypothetical protein n=1 Tax=Treponema denticola TaxID=158 RepID=UPI0002B5F1F0|nr:hypothetical protein [Treponema denticola]EMB39868.1 hypothetical protein HMPREF9722_01670 [Treponema denticola ATCC 33520]